MAIVSTYPPRHCGLASFANDLYTALILPGTGIEATVCAVDRAGLVYPPEVTTVIDEMDLATYRRAARTLHARGTEVVLIQHEYGIFGGLHGSHVLALTDELTLLGVPYIVTLHTVLSQPDVSQARVLAALCHAAAAVTVFSATAVQLAQTQHLVPHGRIAVVPHGTPPTLSHPDPMSLATPWMADLLAATADRRLLSTFGLLGPGKGIDTAIIAMATVVRQHPDVAYIVAGATHPNELHHHGETYRQSLQHTIDETGLSGQVMLANRYLTVGDISALLSRTYLYLTPYRNREQICSGTLAYALGAGCPAVSTDYAYARDLIAGAAGRTVPPDDPQALAGAITSLLQDSRAYAEAKRCARRIGAQAQWPTVGRQVADLVRTYALPRSVRNGAGVSVSRGSLAR